MFLKTLETPIGLVTLLASEKGLRRLDFGGEEVARKHLLGHEVERHMPFPVEQQLAEYFAGTRKEFDLPLDWEDQGTEFQLRCWKALQTIPYGQVVSYGQQAVKVGSPKGFRAVGQANHHNPLAIIVPCHRVITSNRKLGGFGGGLPVKQFLLDLEGAVL